MGKYPVLGKVDRILYYQNCVTDTVSEKLHNMDEKYGIPPHKEESK